MNSESFLFRFKSWLMLLFGVGSGGAVSNFSRVEGKVERILCATAAGIGDTIMVADAIAALKGLYPEAKLTVLCHYDRGADEVCRLMRAVDDTVDIGLASYRWGDVIKFMFGGFWKLVFGLRRHRFDLGVVFMPNVIRRLVLAGAGCERWVYGTRIDDYPGSIASELVRLIGCEVEVGGAGLFCVDEPENAEEILGGELERPLIGVHPFCGTDWRGWDKFDELLDRAGELGGSTIVVGKSDGYRGAGRGHDLVNKLSLAELFWVISKLDVFITADSGPMHIALGLGVPTVALFGPVRPEMRVKDGEMHKHRIIYKVSGKSEKTRRITRRKVLDNSAMQSITVDEVMAVAKELL